MEYNISLNSEALFSCKHNLSLLFSVRVNNYNVCAIRLTILEEIIYKVFKG